MTRIHITGCPRIGTTLMSQLMRIGFHFSGFCEHEMSIFEEPEGALDFFLSKQPSDIKRIGPLLKLDKNKAIYSQYPELRDSWEHLILPDRSTTETQ